MLSKARGTATVGRSENLELAVKSHAIHLPDSREKIGLALTAEAIIAIQAATVAATANFLDMPLSKGTERGASFAAG